MTTKRNAGEDTSAEFNAFTATVDRLLAIPKSEILRREAEYRRQLMRIPGRVCGVRPSFLSSPQLIDKTATCK
jgi:hypothetical protein